MDKLHVVAKYLMKYEKVDGATFEKLMNGELTEASLWEKLIKHQKSRILLR